MIAERGVRVRTACVHSPREPPRETDFAARHPEGDGFRLVSVSLACFRDIPPGKLPRGRPRVTPPAARLIEGDRAPAGFFSLACLHGIPTGQLPRDCPRETDFAARHPEGDGFRLVSVSLACFRDIPPGKLPRNAPRETDSAARHPKGDGFRPISVASGRSRGSRRSAGAARPPSTQKARLERRAFTKNYARVLELRGSARRRGKKKCKRRTRCTRPR